MKSILKKTIITAAFVTVLAIAPGVRAQQLNKFSGHWVLDESASDFGNKTKSSFETEVNIAYDTKTLSITRFFKNDDGTKDSYSEALSLDGKPLEVQTEPNAKKSVHLANPSATSFTEEADYQTTDPNNPLSWHGTIIWTISEDSKYLTASNIYRVGDHEGKTKAVFKKQ